MSPDSFPDENNSFPDENQRDEYRAVPPDRMGNPEDQPGGDLVRRFFEKSQPDLEAKASESMPRDLDALFETHGPESDLEGDLSLRLRELFSRDLLAEDPQVSTPAHLDAATASKLDRRVAEGIRVAEGVRRRQPREAPIPIALDRSPVARPAPLTRAPVWSGLAAAGLLGMLYLWGQGYLRTGPEGQRPLFVLVDVDKPLDTSMDPGAISLAAAGAIDFVEGAKVDVEGGVGAPKKGGEE